MAKKTYPHKQSLRCLCMSLNYRLHKVVESTELRACLNGASLNINSPIIMSPPNILTPIFYDSNNCYDSHIYYKSRNTVSPICGHQSSTIVYPLYNLDCKHRTRTSANYNKCYASLLIVACYEREKKKKYDKKLKSLTKMLEDQNALQRSYLNLMI